MKIKRFEDLIAWQKAQDLAYFIYQNFGSIKDFSFRDQILRAAVSISNNIAEGFDRGSDSEFKRFLFIARGSNSEVKSMLYLALRLELITPSTFDQGIDYCDQTGKLINKFIQYLTKNDQPTND
jgi:four helix bundle protein